METSNKKIKNEDKLLDLFTGFDLVREFMSIPFLHPTYNEVWATDGYVIIRIPPERLNKQYEPTDGCERLKLPTVEHPCFKSCTLAAIKQALGACSLVDEVETEEYEEKCEECDGTGLVEWEYTDGKMKTHCHNFDCPICGGDGVIRHEKETKTGKKVPDENAIIQIGAALFHHDVLQIVAEALKILGADTVNVTANTPYGMTEFEYDGIKIGFMCLMADLSEKISADVKLNEKK